MSWWNPIDDFEKGLLDPLESLLHAPGNAIDSWLKGLGGQIATGLERGGLSILEDVWRTILPAIQIAAGVAIVIIAAFIGKDLAGNL